MFAPNIVTVTINDIEGGIIMFALIIATITLLILAASIAALFVLTLTDYTVARAVIDAIPFDPDAVDAAIASIPDSVKRLAKATKTATKEAWRTTVDIARDIIKAIKAIANLFTTVFDGICDDIADFIGRGNVIVDAIFNRLPKTIVDIDGTTIYRFPFSNNNDGDNDKKQLLHCIWNTATFYIWRFGVGIKDAAKLAIDFIYAAYNYIKAHAPSIMTDIQVNTWNAITGTVKAIARAVKAIISAAKTIARIAREIVGIFAAIARLFGWVSGGIGIDADKVMAKVANMF